MRDLLGILFLVIVILAISLIINRIPDAGRIYTTSRRSYPINQQVEVPIFIDTQGRNINAAEVYLNVDPTKVRIDGVTKNNSFFTLWVKDQPSFSTADGTVSFAGGLPTPGFSGRGQIGTVKLTILSSGNRRLRIDPKTRILLNDGKGTSIPLLMDPITIRGK